MYIVLSDSPYTSCKSLKEGSAKSSWDWRVQGVNQIEDPGGVRGRTFVLVFSGTEKNFVSIFVMFSFFVFVSRNSRPSHIHCIFSIFPAITLNMMPFVPPPPRIVEDYKDERFILNAS